MFWVKGKRMSYIKLCDRCGRQTKNKPAFLEPVSADKGTLNIGGEWFGEEVCLCDECFQDFCDFRWKHKKFKITFEEINE